MKRGSRGGEQLIIGNIESRGTPSGKARASGWRVGRLRR
jgi:hypothetical protein